MCMTHSVQQLYPYAIVMCPVRHKRYARTVRGTKGWKENGTDGMADVFKSVVGWRGTKKTCYSENQHGFRAASMVLDITKP